MAKNGHYNFLTPRWRSNDLYVQPPHKDHRHIFTSGKQKKMNTALSAMTLLWKLLINWLTILLYTVLMYFVKMQRPAKKVFQHFVNKMCVVLSKCRWEILTLGVSKGVWLLLSRLSFSEWLPFSVWLGIVWLVGSDPDSCIWTLLAWERKQVFNITKCKSRQTGYTVYYHTVDSKSPNNWSIHHAKDWWIYIQKSP